VEEKIKPGPDVGRKFSNDGRALPFSGNTIICHLPKNGSQSAAFRTMSDIHSDLSRRSFAKRLSLIPADSFHMTIFGGACDKVRRTGAWPSDVPLDALMSVCNDHFGAALRSFALDCELPIRMRACPNKPGAPGGTIQIKLVPVNGVEATKIARFRDRVAEALKIRAANHATYAFHVTLAYIIECLTPEELNDFTSAYSSWQQQLDKQSPIIELGAPEFCLFSNMLAYETLFHMG
jgi:hypothetical protein